LVILQKKLHQELEDIATSAQRETFQSTVRICYHIKIAYTAQ